MEAPTLLPSSWQIPSRLSSHLWGTYLTVSSLSCLFLVDRVLEKRFGMRHLARGWALGGASAGEVLMRLPHCRAVRMKGQEVQ